MDPREFNLTRHSLERLRERHPLISAEIKKQAGDKGTAIVVLLRRVASFQNFIS